MKTKLFTLLFIVFGIQLMAQTSSTPEIELQSEVMSGFADGWNMATVNVEDSVQIIFETVKEGSGEHDSGYRINGGPEVAYSEKDTVIVSSGNTFSFYFHGHDEFTHRIKNFVPGFEGQFAPENWTFTSGGDIDSQQMNFVNVPITNIPTEECNSRPKRNNFEWIESIKVGELPFNSGKNENAYGDYTETPLVIQPAEVLEVELTPGYKNRNYTEYWRIWIDINNDGDYSDEGEMVFETKGKGMVEGNIPFPDGLVSPDVRVKVAMSWKNYPPLCGSFNSGEVEEYIIQLENVD